MQDVDLLKEISCVLIDVAIERYEMDGDKKQLDVLMDLIARVDARVKEMSREVH